ncbi:hypothetical protein [Jeotgalibacillus campisalis]|uniref:Uncharacterized protein n=1 Tax=Jeotgalibacillus campisalis TaxID=220754 RepID=A0A0C2W983_9BACL|nr:hypothetical protein [Jeotgalibacillus campisalis]KIL53146.1 hypothetical protein KR50_04750 [Jeotgalibacillus campisalis]
MKKGEEIRYVEDDEYEQKTKETKLVYLLLDIEFIEGNTNGVISYFINIRYHNSSEANIEVHPEAWKQALILIEDWDTDDTELWNLLHSWGIYRG